MTSSLVGSEMCIRDRKGPLNIGTTQNTKSISPANLRQLARREVILHSGCLLYTSDAADDM
eukprot:8006020-Prorocentrum_lima.AAC.1